jgi:hypothetical protein
VVYINDFGLLFVISFYKAICRKISADYFGGAIICVPLSQIDIPRFGVFKILSWSSGFYIGALLADRNRLNSLINKIVDKAFIRIGLLVIMVLLCGIRIRFPSYAIYTRYVDIVITIIMMLLVAVYRENMKMIRSILGYFGTISMDLYFDHMFFVEYVTKDFVYSLTDGILMFAIVLCCSILTHYFWNSIRFAIRQLRILWVQFRCFLIG